MLSNISTNTQSVRNSSVKVQCISSNQQVIHGKVFKSLKFKLGNKEGNLQSIQKGQHKIKAKSLVEIRALIGFYNPI